MKYDGRSFFFHAVLVGWFWYIKEKITNSHSPEALRILILDTPVLFYPRGMCVIDYLNRRDSNVHKDILRYLGSAFASKLDSFQDNRGDQVLIRLLATGLPLSTAVGRDGRTIRDHIIKRTTLDNTFDPALLRFIEKPPEGRKIST